MVIKLSISD